MNGPSELAQCSKSTIWGSWNNLLKQSLKIKRIIGFSEVTKNEKKKPACFFRIIKHHLVIKLPFSIDTIIFSFLMHYVEFELNHTWAVKYNTARPRNRYMSPAGHTYETFQLLIRAQKNMKPKDPRATFWGGYIQLKMAYFIKSL